MDKWLRGQRASSGTREIEKVKELAVEIQK
jgi:hypothetical protein